MKWSILALFFALILSACGGQSGTTGGGNNQAASGNSGTGTFNVTVSGAVDGTLASPADTAHFSREVTDGNASFVAWFGNGDTLTLSVVFYGDVIPDAGTYEIKPLDVSSDLSGQITGIVVSNTDAGMQNLANSEGSITFDSAGKTYSGSLEFTVTDPEDKSATATVKGTFSDIAFVDNGGA